MKKRHVLHRDLKLENIVIFDNMVLKIADFGNAMHILTGERRSFCGTREYLSPVFIYIINNIILTIIIKIIY